MADERTIFWRGKSGKEYKYWINPIGASFKSEPGNYIFAKETSPREWLAVYVGQTNDLARRLNNPDSHEKMPCIRRYGGTHIHAHITGGSDVTRRNEESDIRDLWNPECNLED